MKLREFDRQIGALFGLAKGALYCILITLFAITLMGESTRTAIVQSKSGHYIAQVLDRSQAVIPPEIHEVVQPYLDRFEERFNDSDSNATFNRMPWLAGQSGGVPAGGLRQHETDNTSVNQRTAAPLPASQQWPPQRAQQPMWNQLQR